MKSGTISGNRETRRFKEKRDAILNAGARLFNQHGVRGTTLGDIAQSVGLVTNSVTYYYRKKEDLAAACLLSSMEIIGELVASAEKQSSPSQRIRALFASYIDLLAQIERGEHPELALFNDIRALTGPQMQSCFDAYTDMFRAFRRLVRAAPEIAVDRIRENSQTHLVLSVFVDVKQLARRFHVEEYPRIATRLTDVLVNGLFAADRKWPDLGTYDINGAAQPDAEISAESFLRAATVLINEQGYRGASVDKISAHLNVTKGSFYHHNDNKDDLVTACFARSFDIVHEAQNEASERFTTGAERLAAISSKLAASQVTGHGPLLRTTAWSALPEGVRYGVLRSLNRQTQRFASIINDGYIDGSVRPVDPLIAAHATSTMINAVAEIERWVPAISADNILDLYVRPFFFGAVPETA